MSTIAYQVELSMGLMVEIIDAHMWLIRNIPDSEWRHISFNFATPYHRCFEFDNIDAARQFVRAHLRTVVAVNETEL